MLKVKKLMPLHSGYILRNIKNALLLHIYNVCGIDGKNSFDKLALDVKHIC